MLPERPRIPNNKRIDMHDVNPKTGYDKFNPPTPPPVSGKSHSMEVPWDMDEIESGKKRKKK